MITRGKIVYLRNCVSSAGDRDAWTIPASFTRGLSPLSRIVVLYIAREGSLTEVVADAVVIRTGNKCIEELRVKRAMLLFVCFVCLFSFCYVFNNNYQPRPNSDHPSLVLGPYLVTRQLLLLLLLLLCYFIFYTIIIVVVVVCFEIYLTEFKNNNNNNNNKRGRSYVREVCYAYSKI